VRSVNQVRERQPLSAEVADGRIALRVEPAAEGSG